MIGCVAVRVGILSDTHDRLSRIDEAVRRLNAENVDLVLHAGDYVSPFVIPELAGLEAGMIGVLGNNDGDPDLLRKRSAEHDHLEIRGLFTEIRADDLDVGLLHGHDTVLLRALIRSGAYGVIVHGHTHQAGISRQGSTLIINPGEVCGYLTGTSTIALLDTESGEAKLLTL